MKKRTKRMSRTKSVKSIINMRRVVLAFCVCGMMLFLTGCERPRILLTEQNNGPDAPLESKISDSAGQVPSDTAVVTGSPEQSQDDAVREQDLQQAGSAVEVSEPQEQEVYWTLSMPDYEIIFQSGEEPETMELLFCRDGERRVLQTLEKGPYLYPSDVFVRPFTESDSVLGRQGFRFYQRNYLSLSQGYFYYGIICYSVEENGPVPIADYWGGEDEEVYYVDVDGDGIDEMICNVMWMDGVRDVLIFHSDGEKIWKGYGSELLQEPYEPVGIGSLFAEYLPEENKVLISYYQEKLQDYAEKKYDIDLKKLELYEYEY